MKRVLSWFLSHSVYGVFLLCLVWPALGVAQSEQGDYRLAAGDVLEVRVYGEDDLSMQLAIPGNGRVEYACLGQFMLAGKTVAEVQQEIYQRLLGDYLIRPQVSVSVATYRDFYVHGAVNRPGNYSWQPGLTVRKVITLAGGLKERASGSKWYLVAENTNERERVKVKPDESVHPGDTLTIEQSFF